VFVQGPALYLFAVQLVLDAVWSWFFFLLHDGAIAFVGIVLLWIAVVATLVLFWRLITRPSCSSAIRRTSVRPVAEPLNYASFSTSATILRRHYPSAPLTSPRSGVEGSADPLSS
jgi:TspO/MBR family protein